MQFFPLYFKLYEMIFENWGTTQKKILIHLLELAIEKVQPKSVNRWNSAISMYTQTPNDSRLIPSLHNS